MMDKPQKPWLLGLMLLAVIAAIVWLHYYAVSNGVH